MFDDLKYPDAVRSMYEALNEKVFDSELELADFVKTMSEKTTIPGELGITPELVDAQFEIGVLNGYSIEYQLSLVTMFLDKQP